MNCFKAHVKRQKKDKVSFCLNAALPSPLSFHINLYWYVGP